MSRAPDYGSVGVGMSVGSVRPNSDVDRNVNRRLVCGTQQAARSKLRIGDLFQPAAESFAISDIPQAWIVAKRYLAARPFGGSESSIRQHRFDILTGLAGDGDLEIVNRGG